MVARHKIMIVDDDEDILELLKYNLSKEGYIVRTLSESKDAVNAAVEFHPDLVILDLMMSPRNGIDICRDIRSYSQLKDIYIFFLTAKSDEYYQHAVFNVGGDEFVEKIVGLKPLLTKVSSVLRQSLVIKKRLTKLKAGPLELYRGVETVYHAGTKIALSKPEFEILFFMAQNPGKTISLSQIIKTLWGSTVFMDELAVRNFLDNLKRKVGRELIREQRVGYFKFCDVTKLQ
jgi:two-component system, OmpR family, alkaline phosphatase synthesis response regulator PhoP